ncbi:GNAT family N-acetyltransferase [Actinocrinis sp.]|uniref:GNAT family N-acetyltransferase n=1 Tax=Actinocrinis sp. TaxID=1920516 RepID=UPI002D6F7C96|nr:GNAT family N-acetyltransferase [Actinocrinis sp.]HZP51961.1 GNAT family N-acetyltransferase [Actinocrinis sp.]
MAFDVQRHDRALALRARSTARAGPFLCRFSRRLPDAFANFAIPDDGAEPTAADIRALLRAFEQRGRTARLEFLAGCAPKAERALVDAGFTVERRGVVMACTAPWLTAPWLTAPQPLPGLVLAEPSCDADLEEFARVQHYAFGQPGEAGPEAVERLVQVRTRGALVMLARHQGRIVGGGVCMPPVNSVGELDGVAVAEDARRRGIGTAISARLTGLAFRDGYHLVWLEPVGPEARQVYRGIGYRPIAERLRLGAPSASAPSSDAEVSI